MKMTRYLAAISIALLSLVSCRNGLSLPQAVSFVGSGPIALGDDTAIFSIVTQGFTSEEEVTIPIIFGGTAEMGKDYTVSAEAFTCSSGSPADSIVITTLVLGSDKTVEMTLDVPEGIETGTFTSAGFTLHDKLGYISFVSSNSLLADTLTFSLAVLNRDTTVKAATRDIDIDIKVDTESSTAEEGTHFTFPDSSRVTLKTGEKSTSVRIASVGEGVPGKDRIVLRFDYDRELYGELFIPETEISLLGQSWAGLDGKWTIDTLVTDSLYMAKIWKDQCTLLENLPRYSYSDAVTFDLATSRFTPSLRSTLKDYFIGESYVSKGDMLTLDLGNGETAGLQTFWFSNTNRFFSSEERSEDAVSAVGMRMVKDEETSENILDLYILDHTSKAFMPELAYPEEKPAAAEYGKFINVTFGK